MYVTPLTSLTLTPTRPSAGYDGLNETHAALAVQSLTAGTEVPLELEIIAPVEDGFSVRAPAIDAQLRAAGAAV